MKRLFPEMTDRPEKFMPFAAFGYWIFAFVLMPVYLPLIGDGLWEDTAAACWLDFAYHAVNALVIVWMFKGYFKESFFNVQLDPRRFFRAVVDGLLLMLFVVTKARRFDGENTWFYFLWYGVGRFWIEGLRTDSLYLFDWTFLGEPIRVSQALSAVMALVAAGMLFYQIAIKKRTADGLWVNRVAAMESAAESAEETHAQAEEPVAEEPDMKHDTEEADNGDQN